MRVAALFVLCVSVGASHVEGQSSGVGMARDGWQAIQRGDGDAAASAFERALAVAPQEPTLHLGLGLALHLLGRDTEARGPLARALELDPRLTPAALLQGQIAYAAGELDAAIAAYERALSSDPDNPSIQRQLERWRREADLHNRFQEQPGIRFRVLFEGPAEQQLAEHVSAVLEKAYWRIGAAMNQYPPDTITVILYTGQQFQDITRSPGWAGGAFDGRIRVPVGGASQSLADLDRVVTHELVHAIVKSVASRGVPTWLNEGLATIFEGGDAAWPRREVQRALTLIPLATLESGFEHLDQRRALLAYAEGAVAAQFLLDRLGWSLPAFLQELGAGKPVDDALRQFMVDPADLQEALVAARGPAADRP